MNLGCFSGLLSCLMCSACLAGAHWKAPGLAKSLREADKVVEREQERQKKVAGFFGESRPFNKGGEFNDILELVKKCNLFTQTQQARIHPLMITDNSDGISTLLATWSRDTKGKNFHTKEELSQIADWERRIRESRKSYERRKAWHRNSQIVDDPAKDRNSEMQRLTANRAKALEPVFERAAKRAERYTIVKLELRISAAQAATLDREVLRSTAIVPALFLPTDCDLDIVDPDLDWPAFISSIRADLVEIDPSVLRKGNLGQD